ncbi:RNA polymerase sigma factor sigB [Amaranthus tricolor]|uniref:RNA polymerase sigma factor sigB n=1 Tax=Amaranthus tricolor TaxID=29722 RepID=UPI00258DC582|nr:RNA polymerase sigma factor sigB [Amaranthus tricolor]
MTCLLPQFKCQPDTFSISSILHPPASSATSLFRNRDLVSFRPQCAVSTPPPPTTTSDTSILEKLRLPYIESNSSSLPAYAPSNYLSNLSSPTEAKFDTALAARLLIEDEEAVIAAAAAEALALARAAAKLAKDAALMAVSSQPTKSASSSAQSVHLNGAKDLVGEHLGTMKNFESAGTSKREGNLTEDPVPEPDDMEPTNEELQRLEAELAESITVRSTRQGERKARRARASEKAASNVVTLKIGSNSRRKRTSVQEVDYSDPLRYLRGTTSSSRLLTANEELELSAGIQDLLKLERLHDELHEKFGDEPSFAQWAAAAGIDQRTLRKRLNHGVLCKDKMIKSNIRLVISIAKNYQGAGMNLQDLVQEGCRGLVRGAEKFDASRGFKFSTYAHWWIKQAVRKSLSDQSRTIRLPFHMVEATYRVKEARKQLYSENGRQPDNEEVAEATGLSMKRLTAVLMTPKAPRSLDQKVGDNMNLKPSEVIADPEAETSEDILTKQFMKQDLDKVLDTLSPREKQVIQWRFGLEDGRMKTLQEIGELMGVSRERIRQIESLAFRKLQQKKRTKHLQQYLYS